VTTILDILGHPATTNLLLLVIAVRMGTLHVWSHKSGPVE
jgi:hypothetical protein